MRISGRTPRPQCRMEKGRSLFREQRGVDKVSKSIGENAEIGVSVRPGKVLSSQVGKY